MSSDAAKFTPKYSIIMVPAPVAGMLEEGDSDDAVQAEIAALGTAMSGAAGEFPVVPMTMKMCPNPVAGEIIMIPAEGADRADIEDAYEAKGAELLEFDEDEGQQEGWDRLKVAEGKEQAVVEALETKSELFEDGWQHYHFSNVIDDGKPCEHPWPDQV
jgi:hypothetical protein